MKIIATLLAALFATAVCADTTLQLPNSAVTVIPNYSNTTTVVSMGSTTFKGPSQFYYVGECAQPDGPRYHCNVEREDQVVLTAPNGATMIVSLTAQFAATLLTSGHNQWRNSQIVVTPSSVTLP